MISAAELASLRATLTTSLPGTVTVTRSSVTSDGFGGQTEAWAAIGTVAARVSPTGSGSESITAGGVVAVAPWTVTLPWGTDITERDRMAYGGQTLEVISTSTPRDWGTAVRCDCREVA